MKRTIILFFFGLCLFSCKKEDMPKTDVLINPSDANALSEVLIMPNGAQSNTGTPPSPSNTPTAPEASTSISNTTSSNGSTAPLSFNYNNVSGNLAGCYVQVDGANSYYTIPYNGNSGNSGALQVPLGIPTNVDQGEFCVNYCVYDNNGQISNIVSSCVSVLRLGTGALQVSLSWNNDTDQDLYVTDPNGEVISYLNTYSSSGGELDRDDTDGYGPENIFWLENAPDGNYSVQVNDFDDLGTVNTFYITVSGPNQSRNFNGTTQNGSTANVISFTKTGNNISF